MRTNRWLLAASATPVLAAMILASWSCMNTPTYPLPPPDRSMFEAPGVPDVDGFVEIVGLTGAFPEGEGYGFIMNLNTDRGVVEPVNPDGSFYARLEASSGDVISVRFRSLEGEESLPIEFVIP